MLDERQGDNQQDGTLTNEGIETAETHRSTYEHIKKAKEFNQYKDLYLLKIHPCLTKEEELRKRLEDPSLSGRKSQVALDVERLERFLSTVKSEVQKIESSRDWINIPLLKDAVKDLERTIEATEKIVEQGNITDRTLPL